MKPMAKTARPRGRPPKDTGPAPMEDVLQAALHSFATHGFNGVSVRTLNRELGVSHNLLHQRYGSKDAVWRAAVNWGFGRLVELEYKADWYGREVIVVDRFFPSSKLCSACGSLAEAMPLNVRTWTCGSCGTAHDRDVNAANNLLAAGLAVSVCGAGVRPQRRTPGGQSATKQKTPRREP